MSLKSDIKTLATIQKLRGMKLMSDRPSMPELTPASGSTIGLAAALIAVATNVDAVVVQCVALAGAALLGIAIAWHDKGLRVARNDVEIQRIAAAAEPNVLVHSGDPEDE